MYRVPRTHYPNETEAEIGDTADWVKGNHAVTAGFDCRPFLLCSVVADSTF